jgi:peptidyl-prolyl cis-trans isomerase C
MIIRFSAHVLLPVMLVGALFCLTAPVVLAQVAPADPVLAIINGDKLHMSDLNFAIERLPPQARELSMETLFPVLMEGLIGNKLTAQAARKQNLHEKTAHRLTMTRIEDQILERAYVLQEIVAGSTEEALRKQYELHLATSVLEDEVHARHILVETEEQGKEVIAELGKGSDFIQLAKDRSTGPSGPSGGDLGFFGEGQMVEPFAKAAFSMMPGESSTVPVKTKFGWHVILVEDRRASQPPSFAEAEEKVRNELGQAIRNDLIKQLRAAADIQQFGPDGKRITP